MKRTLIEINSIGDRSCWKKRGLVSDMRRTGPREKGLEGDL